MPGTCKQCHGQTGSEHQGSKWGFDQCILPHNDDCPGGIVETPGVRKACPIGFKPKQIQSGNETEVSQQRYSDLESDSTESDPDYLPPESKESKNPVTSDPVFIPSLPGSLPMVSMPLSSTAKSSCQSTTPQPYTSFPHPLMSDGFNASNSLFTGLPPPMSLGGSLPQSAGQGTPADLSQTWLLQQLFQQQQSMQLQQQRQQQAMMQENQRVMDEMRVAVEEAKKAAKKASSTGRRSSVSFSDTLVTEVEALKADNGRGAKQKTGGVGLTMNDIRRTPGLRGMVEEIMENDVHSHASLAHTPTAGSSVHGVQADLCERQGVDIEASVMIAALREELAEKQRSLDSLLGSTQTRNSKSERRAARRIAADKAAAALAAAKTATRLAKRDARKLGLTGVSSSSDTSGTETDDERDLDQTLTKVKKLSKKLTSNVTNLAGSSSEEEELPNILTDEKGRAFQVIDGKLQPLPTYVKDPVSGKLIRTTPSSAKLSSSESPDDRAAKKKVKKTRQRARRVANSSEVGEDKVEKSSRIHGITPLQTRAQHKPPVPHLQENRGKNSEGTERWSVVDWAKMCPIKYASTCNSKNLNLPVFMWAKLAELRALSAGAMETNLKPGELDARLRHLQCVMELVGTNSILTEYSGYGWQLGRDYDRKVQATMDSGASDWVTFNSMFSLGPHPSFVLSAKDEVEKVTKKIINTREDDPNKKKKVCGKFNCCKTAKRCDWEVENPNSGRCKRLHQCSYCKATHSKSVFHQAWDCPAGGKEAVAAGTHSL